MMNTIREKGLSTRIKALRVALGVTQEELASLVGVGLRQISRWEHGEQLKPHPSNLRRIEELERRALASDHTPPHQVEDVDP